MVIAAPKLTLSVVGTIDYVTISSKSIYSTIVGLVSPTLNGPSVYVTNTCLWWVALGWFCSCWGHRTATLGTGCNWVVMQLTAWRRVGKAFIHRIAFTFNSVAITQSQTVEYWTTSNCDTRLGRHWAWWRARFVFLVADDWGHVRGVSSEDVTENSICVGRRAELGRAVVEDSGDVSVPGHSEIKCLIQSDILDESCAPTVIWNRVGLHSDVDHIVYSWASDTKYMGGSTGRLICFGGISDTNGRITSASDGCSWGCTNSTSGNRCVVSAGVWKLTCEGHAGWERLIVCVCSC